LKMVMWRLRWGWNNNIRKVLQEIGSEVVQDDNWIELESPSLPWNQSGTPLNSRLWLSYESLTVTSISPFTCLWIVASVQETNSLQTFVNRCLWHPQNLPALSHLKSTTMVHNPTGSVRTGYQATQVEMIGTHTLWRPQTDDNHAAYRVP
jgi:hypothetical protein